jgi:hypothetical protein
MMRRAAGKRTKTWSLRPELLMVLDRSEIPLHIHGSERDIRCQIIKRKISGGTHSGAGPDCLDAFLGLMHTCGKLGIAFWDYLGDRLDVAGQAACQRSPISSIATGSQRDANRQKVLPRPFKPRRFAGVGNLRPPCEPSGPLRLNSRVCGPAMLRRARVSVRPWFLMLPDTLRGDGLHVDA